MKAFLTGSQVYGTPREDSDIDLVVMMDESELDLLLNMLFGSQDSEAIEAYGVRTACFRFGRLNLLVATDKSGHDAWREGTDELIARRPVTRDEAIAVFKAKRETARAKRDEFLKIGVKP